MGALFTGGGSVAYGLTARKGIEDYSARLAGRMTGSGDKEQAMGEFLKGKEGTALMGGLIAGDTGSRASARSGLQSELADPKDDPLREVKQKMLAGAEYNEAVIANKGPLTGDAAKAWEKKTGHKVADAEASLGAMAKILDTNQRRDLSRAARGATARAGKETDKLAALGVYDAASGGLTAAKAAELTKMGGGALEYAKAGAEQLKIESRYGGTADSAESDYAGMGKVQALGKANSDRLAKMSVGELNTLQKSLGGDMGDEAGRSAGMRARLSGRGGITGGVNTILGSGFSKGQLKGMDLTGAGAAGMLAGAGIDTKSDAGSKMVADLQNAAKGGKGDVAEALKRITQSSEFKEGKKKKEMEGAEEHDPLQAAIKKNGEKSNDMLAKLVLYSGKTADEISKLKAKDAEEK